MGYTRVGADLSFSRLIPDLAQYVIQKSTMKVNLQGFGLATIALTCTLIMTATLHAWPAGDRAQRMRSQGNDHKRQQEGRDRAWRFLADKYDTDKDGRLTKDEYDRGEETFERLDRNKDGVLTADDWKGARGRRRPGSATRGEAPTVGKRAPDFELAYVKEPDRTVRLSSFVGKQPVALIFGSCT